MQHFQCSAQAQRFLSAHGVILNLSPRRKASAAAGQPSATARPGLLDLRFLLITLLFGFAAAAACCNGQDSGDRGGQGRGRSPHEAMAKRPAMQAMAEERIRTSMPKSYDCDHFNLKKVEQVELTPGHLAASGRERWCLHLEYECRTGPTGKRKEFASVVEVIYVDADASVVTDLAMGPLFRSAT